MSAIDTIAEHKIRERAFALWQEAGCPEGRAEEFWHRAYEAEINADRGLFGNATPPTGDTQNFA